MVKQNVSHILQAELSCSSKTAVLSDYVGLSVYAWYLLSKTVSLSVCPSITSSIVSSKRLNLLSKFFLRLITTTFEFPETNRRYEILTRSPITRALNTAGAVGPVTLFCQ